MRSLWDIDARSIEERCVKKCGEKVVRDTSREISRIAASFRKESLPSIAIERGAGSEAGKRDFCRFTIGKRNRRKSRSGRTKDKPKVSINAEDR